LFTLDVGGVSERKIVQVVRPSRPGFLREVRLPLSCARTARVQLEIRRVLSVNSVGARFAQPSATVVLAGSSLRKPLFAPPLFQPLQLSTPVFIPMRQRFGVSLAADVAGCTVFGFPTGNPYAGGDAFVDARPSPPGVWTPLSFGSDVSEGLEPPRDVPFQTFVEPACLVPAVRGFTLASARAALRQYGCTPGKATRVASRIKRGRVITTAPRAGTRLRLRGVVRLKVSAGRT